MTHYYGGRCLLDTAPRKMTAEQYNVLNNFAELAIRRLEDKHYPDFKVRFPTVCLYPQCLVFWR